jgi:3,4-dihydroxy 2-butanone 4-phosphate synthase / GTP cyclohydrolase II
MQMFNKTEELIHEISAGKMVILLDDESRENEGDLVFAAKFADKEKINFLLNHARGLICFPLSNERADELSLRNMTDHNTESHQTAFTVSVDAANHITTGISASDRAATIQLLANKKAGKNDFVTPGHMFPLKAKKGGVLERQGHTEATVDLVKLAGIESGVGVICEIIKDNGDMARKDDLMKFACKHNIKIGTIKDLIEYRKYNQEVLKIEAETEMPINGLGMWKLKVFRNIENNKENIALIKGDLDRELESVLTRVHSECFTGDVLGSEKCDCNYQLKKSMKMINDAGKGIIIYLRQEGRGIGLINKIRAYKLQNEGFDTLDANIELGFQPDLREYSEAAEILKKLNVSRVKLITNNQDKIDGLTRNDIEVTEQIVVQSIVNENNKKYLKTKKERFGHKIVEFEMCI